jgi:hypothetical protein
VPEAPRIIAGFNDVAVMGQPIQQRRRHLGVAKYGWPFRKAKVGGDCDTGALVQLRQQMEQQRTAGLAKRQIAQLVKNHEVGIHQPMRDLSLFAGRLLQLQRIDELDGGEEAYSLAMPADCLNTQGGGQMCLAGARSANEDQIVRGVQKRQRVQETSWR